MIIETENRERPLALIVDDDLTLRLTMGAALKKAGLDIAQTETGRQGIDLFESKRPDIIFLDVGLPDMNGFEVCEKIQQHPQGRFTPIIMVTGLEDIQSIENAFNAGASEFVSKPLNLKTLGHHVLYMLRAGRAFQDLSISKRRTDKTQKLAGIGHWQTDFKHGLISCSRETCRILSITPYHMMSEDSGGTAVAPGGTSPKETEMVLDRFLASIMPGDRERVKASVVEMIAGCRPGELEYVIKRPDGAIRHILNKSELIYNENREPAGLLGVVQDVTPMKQAQEEIRYLALYDSLTGLANRMLFMDRLDQAIRAAERKGTRFAVLFMDLDHFKQINDTLGHQIGDMLLKTVTKHINKSIRCDDVATRMHCGDEENTLVARLGGDEFSILVNDLKSPDNAALVARRLLDNISSIASIDDKEISISTSIGISIFPDDGDRSDKLLKNADTAMYHAKKEGRNTYQFFTRALNQEVIERFSIRRDLDRAFEKDEFSLFYQPKLRLSDRRIIGAEALIRWQHSRRGLIPPDKFISIAEESGTIVEINKWVITEACRQTAAWLAKGLPPISVAVNLSGYKLAEQDIVSFLKQALDRHHLAPGTIEIELTENVLMAENNKNISILEQIKAVDCTIALDDFGTGYSSLSYLTSFPVDTLKIDRSFIMDLSPEQKSQQVIVNAIIALGHSLGVNVVAEGIETEDHYEFLRSAGCDQGQGYHFSRPLPADEFELLLEKKVL